ncbi:MAG: hypothetical protein IKU80_00765, partial [Firmicutes bacterium]|nr:hypothetical protein [Bacillota bacterium]
KIESVSITYPGTVQTQIYSNGEDANINEVYYPDFVEAEDIANVVALHRHKIVNRDGGGRSLPIIYTLKDGCKVYREYTINFDIDKDIAAPVYASDVYKKYQFPVYDGTTKTPSSFHLSYMDNFIMEINSKAEMAKHEEALIKDI